MKVEIDTELAIVVVDVGKVTQLSDLQDAVLAMLGHPEHIDGMDTIFDFRQADLTFATKEIIEAYARWLAPYLPRIAKRVATVVQRDLEFGIVRMWNTHAEGISDQQRMIFRDMESAREWLLSIR